MDVFLLRSGPSPLSAWSSAVSMAFLSLKAFSGGFAIVSKSRFYRGKRPRLRQKGRHRNKLFQIMVCGQGFHRWMTAHIGGFRPMTRADPPPLPDVQTPQLCITEPGALTSFPLPLIVFWPAVEHCTLITMSLSP